MTISPDKEKAVDTAMLQIERQFGKGSIMKLGSQPIINVPVISTGSIALDLALGIGGLPRGRVTEVYGPESSGKTTLALHAVANAQKQGGIAAFIDAEHALDTAYAKRLNVNPGTCPLRTHACLATVSNCATGCGRCILLWTGQRQYQRPGIGIRHQYRI